MKVFLGLDGVTLCMKNKAFRPYLKEAIEKLKGNGHEVFFWTEDRVDEKALAKTGASVVVKEFDSLPYEVHAVVDSCPEGVPSNPFTEFFSVPRYGHGDNSDLLLKVAEDICRASSENNKSLFDHGFTEDLCPEGVYHELVSNFERFKEK